MNSYKAAVVQASPILFDLEATMTKVESLIGKCKKEGVSLALFPEAFVSVYPRGLSFGTVVGSRSDDGRKLWQKLWDSSIQEGDEHCQRLGRMAKSANLFLAIGVNEKDVVSGTLYCSIFYFSSEGELVGKHRKIKPTGQERLIWGEDDGSTLSTFNTGLGRIGGLICWENYMPLARMSMYQKGVQIYLAPTADSRDNWQHTMRHIALEGRCFVLASNQYVTKEMYPQELRDTDEIKRQPDVMSRGGSVIIDPLGNVLAGPLWNEEGILTAELNLDHVTQAKMDFDPIGHYQRPDLFSFSVKNQPEIRSLN
ncbi:carbon-nitrogen hydrolase family protein [Roseivirga sp.]|uniref:carbon-nitrogen hydrolase family protein n=1 Tax=Roseivirga sp. TaxID=1964215 RepID=UPI003B51F410